MNRINLFTMVILGALLCGCSQPGNNKQQSSEEKQVNLREWNIKIREL